MVASGIKTGKFSEELYFLLLSAPMRPRIKALAEKYGFSEKELRSQILRSADHIAGCYQEIEAPQPVPMQAS